MTELEGLKNQLSLNIQLLNEYRRSIVIAHSVSEKFTAKQEIQRLENENEILKRKIEELENGKK